MASRSHLLILCLTAWVPAVAAGDPPKRSVEEGPAGYTVACALVDQPGVRSCSDLPAAEACTHEPDFASRASTEPTAMTFVNRSDQTVELYWLDFRGMRKFYLHLSPGARAKQDTFIGHYWLLATPEGGCIAIFKAAPESLAFF
jgi:von Hippel-Lindau disease tumor suppressor protein